MFWSLWTLWTLKWQTRAVVPLFKKGERRVCSNHRGRTLLSFPGKVYEKVLDRRVQPLVEHRIQEDPFSFCQGTGSSSLPSRVLKGSWSLLNQSMCFIDLEMALVRVPVGLLHSYGFHGPLLGAVWCLSDWGSFVYIAGSNTDLFPVHVGLWHGCPSSAVMFKIL